MVWGVQDSNQMNNKALQGNSEWKEQRSKLLAKKENSQQ